MFVKFEIGIIAFLIFLAALVIRANYGLFWMLPVGLLLVFVLFVFRNPRRHPPSSPLAIVAPIDAKVVAVESTMHPFRQQPCQHIRLSRRGLGILALYSPVEGYVHRIWYGEQYPYVDASSVWAGKHIYTTWIQTDEQDDLLMSFYRVRTVRYLQIWPQSGERVGQGKVVGLSSVQYVDIVFPCNADLKVQEGDTVKAGESILGFFVHKRKVLV